jgi:hypothetical protein
MDLCTLCVLLPQVMVRSEYFPDSSKLQCVSAVRGCRKIASYLFKVSASAIRTLSAIAQSGSGLMILRLGEGMRMCTCVEYIRDCAL